MYTTNCYQKYATAANWHWNNKWINPFCQHIELHWKWYFLSLHWMGLDPLCHYNELNLNWSLIKYINWNWVPIKKSELNPHLFRTEMMCVNDLQPWHSPHHKWPSTLTLTSSLMTFTPDPHLVNLCLLFLDVRHNLEDSSRVRWPIDVLAHLFILWHLRRHNNVTVGDSPSHNSDVPLRLWQNNETSAMKTTGNLLAVGDRVSSR